MKGMFSPVITSTSAFILSILAILVIAVSTPGMAQAVTSPAAMPGDVQPGSAVQQSSYYGPKVNPAANFGSLTDNGTAAYMGIGIDVPVGPLHIYSATSTQPETIDLSGAGPLTAQWNNWGPGGASSGTGFLARFSRGTKASPTDVLAGDRLGFNVFGGMAGGVFKHTAAIEAVVGSGTVSGTSLPTYMRFLTTPNGSTTRTERMRIDSAGRVGINTVNPYAGSKLSVVNDNLTDFAGAIGGWTPSGNTGGVAGFHTGARTWGALGAQGNGYGEGVYGQSDNTSCWGFLAGMSNDNITGIGVYGQNNISHNFGGCGSSQAGAWGVTSNSNSSGVAGQVTNSSSTNSAGVYGGTNSPNGTGVAGNNSAGGYAGYFTGNVYISGNLYKSTGAFKIDHPQDPANKYLIHSFVESPDMKNVYDGNVGLDDHGEATVVLPGYFETLNRDFRYQLTAIGESGPNLFIAQKVTGNLFRIAGGKAGMEVSWQVTGIRQDPYAVAHPIVVEQEKPAAEKGTYLHPELYNQPAVKGMNQMGTMQSAAMQAGGQFNMK